MILEQQAIRISTEYTGVDRSIQGLKGKECGYG
jgi:hypothetical protein